MLIGLLIIIFKDTIVFSIINDYINNSYWHESKVEQSTVIANTKLQYNDIIN